MLPSSTRRRFLALSGALGSGMLAASRMSGVTNLAHAADAPGVNATGETPLAPPDKQPAKLRLPDVPGKKLGWAIVGLGQLALEEIMPAFAQCVSSRPTALVSGHPDKARRVAAAYGVDEKHLYDYENFDRLADDPTVDVVYIVLPNSMHAEFTNRALRAKKHVLCEKPMAPTTKECRAMIEAAGTADRRLMIAYRLRYEPFNMRAIELIREGAIGKIKTIIASNAQDTPAPNIRLSKQLAGGPLGDVGIYCLNAARYLTGEEPVTASGFEHRPKDDPRFREVPESVSFALTFPSGALAHCGCSFGSSESRFFRVEGSKGTLEMEQAFAYRGQQLRLRTAKGLQTIPLRPADHFTSEMDHFSQQLLADKPPRTPAEEGLADIRTIKAIERSVKELRAVDVADVA